MNLKGYMKRAEQIYRNHAPEYLKLMKEREALRNTLADPKEEFDLLPAEREDRRKALNARIDKITAKMQEERAAADAEAQAVAREVKKMFDPVYHVSPEALDMATVELLKSGICTDSELEELANRFSGNGTMQRYIGKYMMERENPNTQRAGRVLMANQDEPHLRAINAVITAGTYCMGGATHGDQVAEAMFANLDKLTAPAYAEAPDIES